MYDWVAQHPGGIVAASITYRMGILGFLGGPEVEQDGDLNAGLIDQRAGLEWIQRHIAAFGGDPDNVTISGESAGGASVMMQIVAYGGLSLSPICNYSSSLYLIRIKACSIQACYRSIDRIWSNNVPHPNTE